MTKKELKKLLKRAQENNAIYIEIIHHQQDRINRMGSMILGATIGRHTENQVNRALTPEPEIEFKMEDLGEMCERYTHPDHKKN